MHRSCLFILVLSGSVLATGCGSGTTTSTSGTTRPLTVTAVTNAPSPTTTAPATSASPPTTSVTYSITPVSVPRESGGGTALLTAVRAAAQNGFDRVTFEFANRVPGYSIGYAERPVVQDGSGDVVTMDGSAILAVGMTPASGTDLSGGGHQTYTGPTRFKPGTPMLAELVQAGDFEAHLTWALGVNAKVGFKVSTLQSPPRLVIDIQTV